MNKNTFYFAGTWFQTPFRFNGYWVEDAAGRNVAEASSRELAEALVRMLNNAEKEQANH